MSHSGKTTYAKDIAKEQGLKHIDFDDLWKYGEDRSDEVLAELHKALRESSVILDGMMSSSDYPLLQAIHDRLTDVQPIIVYADHSTLAKRRPAEMSEYDPDQEIIAKRYHEIYRHLRAVYGDEVRFIDTSNNQMKRISELEFLTLLGEPYLADRCQEIVDMIDSMKGDTTYTPLKVGPIKRDGYSHIATTWSKIHGMVDWEGKHVLEVGPHLGYTVLHGYGELAKNVSLIEEHEQACRSLRILCDFHGYDHVDTYGGDFVGFDMDWISPDPDIIVCLNVFYKLSDRRKAARKMFKSGAKYLIFETNEVDIPLLKDESQVCGYFKWHEIDGARGCSGHDRKIIHFHRE